VKDNTQKTKKLPDIQEKQRSQEYTKQTGRKKRNLFFFFSSDNCNCILKNSRGNRHQSYNFKEMKGKLREHIFKKKVKTELQQGGRNY